MNKLLTLLLFFFLSLIIILFINITKDKETEHTIYSLPKSVTEEISNQLKNKGLKTIKTSYLINIWGTWCKSCKEEHDFLLKLSEKYTIIGINLKDKRENAEKWLSELGSPYYLNIIDPDGSISIDLGVVGAPETYLVTSNGKIIVKHSGVLTEKIWNDYENNFINNANDFFKH